MAEFDNVVQALWRGRSPYDGFVAGRFRPDAQGWNSDHPFLADTLRRVRPKLVVEIGVWKGGSTIHMASVLRDSGIDGVVLAVDTWLGSWEHWQQDEWFPSLLCQNGYPSMYYTFLANVAAAGVEGHVLPLPQDSANASFVALYRGLRPQVVHIDAGHDYEAVMADLQRWWKLLVPGGVLIADDYDPEGKVWPTVRDAVDDFLRETPHSDFEAVPYKARFTKP